MNYKIYTILITIAVEINGESYLLKKFPRLKEHIAYVELCDLPTPIIRLELFGNNIGCNTVFMKRDDLSGKIIDNTLRRYGGNKPRKLEFLLGDALKNNAHTIITYGCAGSNHALATAVYTHELGLKSILMLKHQPNSYTVRQNLLLDAYYDAQVIFIPNNTVRSLMTNEILSSDPYSYLIPTGGSNARGVLGFVSAAFELADQITQQAIDEPDFIYVATGSCATTAGLLLGLQVAEVKSNVVAVCIEPEAEPNAY